jgi:hypothetical protein
VGFTLHRGVETALSQTDSVCGFVGEILRNRAQAALNDQTTRFDNKDYGSSPGYSALVTKSLYQEVRSQLLLIIG